MPTAGSGIKPQSLQDCMIADRYRFQRLLKSPGEDAGKLAQQIQASQARASHRRAQSLDVSVPNNLPIEKHSQEIIDAIQEHPVIIVAGETGSGKTTQLPKLMVRAGYGVFGTIGHTQPRRIAARSVSGRIAQELGPNGNTACAYKVRFDDKTGQDCRIKLMTDGILLNELHHDRWLNQYDCLIIDEAHERSLNIDFLLGYLKQLLKRRRDLKLIITSATINTERFSEHFNQAPIIEVSGRTYPVETRYRPIPDGSDLIQAIGDGIEELQRSGKGDVLIFLPGERDIRENKKSLAKRFGEAFEIIPLFGRLSAAEQQRIFSGRTRTRLILATNIAETSITVPGIRYVVDSGLARISRYSYKTKVQRLPVEQISQASANQRMGRCGRVQNGICIRLFGEEDFDSRPEFTQPELLRTNLASVILQMTLLRLGDIESFPFVDKPDSRYVTDGYRLLKEIGALTSQDKITKLGRRIALLPVDPRFGRMLLAAEHLGVSYPILVIVAGLSIQDPKERPIDQQEKADQAHARFAHPQSDFLSLLKLWVAFEDNRKNLTRKELKQWCLDHFLSRQRLFEWLDVFNQLKNMMTGQITRKMPDLDTDPGDLIHQALIPGLLSHFGVKTESHEYDGPRGSRFFIFPGSVVSGKKAKWIVAAWLVETSKLFARVVAPVQPQWLEQAGQHLVKRSYSNLHWREKRGKVFAAEQVSLYGLILVGKRWVDFTAIEPGQSRAVFIQSALVEGRLGSSLPGFLKHNVDLRRDVETLEAKQRRRNLLVADTQLQDFYEERLPDSVNSRPALTQWLKTASEAEIRRLYFSKSDLMSDPETEPDLSLFPDQVEIDGNKLNIQYVFDGSSSEDGATMSVPMALLPQLTVLHTDYLIAGLLKEKVIALIKGLPKNLRRNFVPAPDFADACINQWRSQSQDRPLLANLSQTLHEMTGVHIPVESWQSLPSHLQLKLQILDEDNQAVAIEHDVETLKARFKNHQSASHRHSAGYPLLTGLKSWSFDALPEQLQNRHGDVLITQYPALMDQTTHVDQVLADSAEEASMLTERAIERLFVLSMSQQTRLLRNRIVGDRTLVLNYRFLGTEKDLSDQILMAGARRTFMGSKISDQSSFLTALADNRASFVGVVEKLIRDIGSLLEDVEKSRRWLSEKGEQELGASFDDMHQQLDTLIYPGFIRETHDPWLARLTIYLRGLAKRQNQFFSNRQKDEEYTEILQTLQSKISLMASAQGKERVNELVWMMQEFRVSLFAQGLKTLMPVSAKRIEKKLEALR